MKRSLVVFVALASSCGSAVVATADEAVVEVSTAIQGDTSDVETTETLPTSEATSTSNAGIDETSSTGVSSRVEDADQIEPTEVFQRYEYVYTESRWMLPWPDFSSDIEEPLGPDGVVRVPELVTTWTVRVDELNDRVMVDKVPSSAPDDPLQPTGASPEVLDWASQFEEWPGSDIAQRFVEIDGEVFTSYYLLDDPSVASPWWGEIFLTLRKEPGELELDPGLEHVAAALGAVGLPEPSVLPNGDLSHDLDVDEELVNQSRTRLKDVSVLVVPAKAVREQARVVTDAGGLLVGLVMIHDQLDDRFDLVQYRLTVTDRFAPPIPSVPIEWFSPSYQE